MKRLVAAAALLAILFLTPGITWETSPGVNAQETEKPNIILVNADDLSMADYNKIKPLQSITGEMGATFRKSYVSDALCCPSRVSTLTGRYVQNHGVKRRVGAEWGYNKYKANGLDDETFAYWLKEDGYRTALVGKYMNGYKSTGTKPEGWSEFYGVHGANKYWKLDENGKVKYYTQDRSKSDYRHWEDVLGDKSLSFMRGSISSGEPFMLYYNPHAPHSPMIWPPRHDNVFARASLPTPGNFSEADVSDKPRYIRRLDRASENQKKNWTKKHRQRLRATVSVADQIKRMRNLLKERGELDNTYIIFTSDNGYHLGNHRLPPGKQTPYETDHRVPLTVSGPGIKPGTAYGHLISNIDLAPSIAGLASIEVPGYSEKVDGRSFEPVLDPAQSFPARRYRTRMLLEHYHGPSVPSAIVPPTYAVLKDTGFTYTRYATGEREYYNLRKDPYQVESKHRNLDPDRRRRLEQKISRLVNCVGSSCRTADGGGRQ